jgi:hypothetical protein
MTSSTTPLQDLANACTMGFGCLSFGDGCTYKTVSTTKAPDRVQRCYYVRKTSGGCTIWAIGQGARRTHAGQLR